MRGGTGELRNSAKDCLMIKKVYLFYEETSRKARGPVSLKATSAPEWRENPAGDFHRVSE